MRINIRMIYFSQSIVSCFYFTCGCICMNAQYFFMVACVQCGFFILPKGNFPMTLLITFIIIIINLNISDIHLILYEVEVPCLGKGMCT